MNFRLLSLAGIVMLLSSCKHDFPDPMDDLLNNGNQLPPVTVTDSCHPDTVYFERDILPILTSNCAFSGCHDQGTAQDGIVLTTYGNLQNSSIVTAFDIEESDLYEAITETDPDKIMPPPDNGYLSAAQIALIGKWISQGANNLTCIGGCDTVNVSFSANILPLIENRCKGCHNGDSPGGGIHLSNYMEIISVAEDDRLLGVIKHLNGYKAMPLGGQKLPVCQIKQIEKWINRGMPND